MTLGARLLLSLGALLVVALLSSGALVVGLTRDSLVEQLDADLRAAPLGDIVRPGPGGPRGPDDPDDPDDPTGRRFALVAFDADGEVIRSLASGSPASPDPLPVLFTLPELDALAGGGRIVERSSVDDSIDYRVLVEGGPAGSRLLLAASMTQVESAIRPLVRNLLLVGSTVLAAMVIAGAYLIRRGLRPLGAITATAERISTGRLSERVGLPERRSEVGRLGATFDYMLDRIERAFVEQRAALQAKERSEERMRRFVADASHELRTPLTALRGYVDLYRSGGLTERDELEAAMARMGTESRRMAALVEDLLLLARLDQGRPLTREPVVLSHLVADAVSDARALEPHRPISARVDDGVTVVGDADRLRQVIGNLFANVQVHTPPDAALDVSLSATDGASHLQVADHGPGIPSRQAERVFDRFFRGDAGRSRDRGGSGLGLSIAASVVAAHGGSISVSGTPGGGATFAVELPAAPDTAAAP